MLVFEKYLNSPQHKWNWYMCTFIVSMIPIMMRFLISLDCDVKIFDIKDLLFSGLAMNLSNLNLMGNSRFRQKDRIAVLSGFFILFISAFLGLFFYEEDPNVKREFFRLKIAATVLVVLSGLMSYEATRRVFDKTKKNKT